jgi:hypothetical protein
MWALVWLQMVSGQQVETFHINNYASQKECSERRESAEVMVTHAGAAVVCINLTYHNKE